MISDTNTNTATGQTASLEFQDFLNDIPAETAIEAHEASSLFPHRKGFAERRDFALLLAQDLDEFRELAESHATEGILELIFPVYRGHLRKLRIRHLEAKAGLNAETAEPAGAADRQFRRAKRRAALDRKHGHGFTVARRNWRRNILKILNPDALVIPNTPFELERLAVLLQAAKARQAKMHGINSTLRRLEKAPHEERVAAVVAFGIAPGVAELLVIPGESGAVGFGPFCLANTANEIRQLEKKLEPVAP